MRLRNIPRAEGAIQACRDVVKKPEEWKGCWNQIFGNTNPVHIEIGMGKGRFLLQMAAEHPEVNYIGIERYTSVLLRAVERYERNEHSVQGGDSPVRQKTHVTEQPERKASAEGIQNVRFLCMDAEKLEQVFEEGEVSRIYLNFSDPWPKTRHAKRRLTSKEFLARYRRVLPSGGEVEFKTDNTELFRFSLEQIGEASGWVLGPYTFDLHRNAEMNRGNVMTEYEEKFSARGHRINKLIAIRR